MITTTTFAPAAGRTRLSLSEQWSLLASIVKVGQRRTILRYILFMLVMGLVVWSESGGQSVLNFLAAAFFGVMFGLQASTKGLTRDQARSFQLSTADFRTHIVLTFVVFGAVVQLSLLAMYVVTTQVSWFEDAAPKYVLEMWLIATVFQIITMVVDLARAHKVDPSAHAPRSKESDLDTAVDTNDDRFVLDALVFSRFRSATKIAMKFFWAGVTVISLGTLGAAVTLETSIEPKVMIFLLMLVIGPATLVPSTLASTFHYSMAFSLNRAHWAKIPFRVTLPACWHCPLPSRLSMFSMS